MKKVFIGAAIVFILIAFVVAGPFIYNYHLFPLASLKNSINKGDDYAEVVQKFKKYQLDHQGESELQVSIDEQQLFVYHVNAFDDCQLTVNFDLSGKVTNIKYIGD